MASRLGIFWLHYRKKHSRMAKAIESQTNRDVSELSDEDFLELEETFKLVSKRLHCPIDRVQGVFMNQMEAMRNDSYRSLPPDAWEYESVYAFDESVHRQVKKENTANYLYAQWVREMDGLSIDDLTENPSCDSASMAMKKEEVSDSAKETIVSAMTSKPYKYYTPSQVSRIYDSLERLAFKYECPIGQLKKAVVNDLDNTLASRSESLFELSRQIRLVEVPAEAEKFGIDECETGQFLVATWLEERAYQIVESEQMLENFRNQLKEEGMLESVENKMEELRLAPDLSKNNNLENKLFKLAHQLADYIGYYYKPFPDDGFYEALMYCGILLLNFRSDYENELDLDKVQDAFFLLLWDEILPHTQLEIEDVPRYFNQRVIAWGKDEKRMAEDASYKPLALFNAFYVAPLQDISNYYEIPVAFDADVFRFRAVLDAMKVQLGWKMSVWKEDVDFIGQEIRERVESLKQKGLTPLAISQMIGPLESDPFGLIIDEDYRIWLDNPEHTEVKLPPIHKAVYLLFLKHPEGINFKDMDQYRGELEQYYMNITRRNNLDEIQATIERLISPLNNSLNEKCARIKGIFAGLVPEDMVKWYAIDGERGGEKRIRLLRIVVQYKIKELSI